MKEPQKVVVDIKPVAVVPKVDYFTLQNPSKDAVVQPMAQKPAPYQDKAEQQKLSTTYGSPLIIEQNT